MKIVLRKESNIPYYQQIYMQIVERVQSGMLSHGDSLPSLRSMAEDLQISLLTVRKAYKQLEKKEYIRIQQGKGAYIHKHVKKISNQFRINGNKRKRLMLCDLNMQ